MTEKLFNKLWFDALAQPDRDLYIAEYGFPDWFDYIGSDLDTVVSVLDSIHSVAHMSIKDMIARAGLSQAKFALRFCIPRRTVENWCMGVNKCPDYDRLAFAFILGILDIFDRFREGQ